MDLQLASRFNECLEQIVPLSAHRVTTDSSFHGTPIAHEETDARRCGLTFLKGGHEGFFPNHGT